MKEAFWGVLIVMLGLLGIVILQVFQNITITNDQTYYLLKEATEASMLDSIDLAYYRTKGKIKIVKDKFVENLARRFAESANINDNYDIVVHDIIEEPPKISLSIGAYVFSLKGDTFNIGQSISSIIESKYNSTTIGETPVTPPVDPPEEPDEGSCPVCNEGDPNCSPVLECIPGDLRFKNWGEVNIPNEICDASELVNKTRTANYETCECGKWKVKNEDVNPTITNTKPTFIYTWHFLKSSTVRALDLTATKGGRYSDYCITEVGFANCPDGTVYMQKGSSTKLIPTYVPPNAVNRDLTWTSTNTNVATVLDDSGLPGPTGFDEVQVFGVNNGETDIKERSTNGHEDSCHVIVTDELICENVTIPAGGKKTLTLAASSPKPSGLTWSIPSGSSIATINGSTGEVIVGETATTIDYVVSAPGYNPATCHITITDEVDDDPTGCTPGSISVKWDTKNLWPNRTGPTMCPQDFEAIQRCEPNPYGPPTCSSTPLALSKLKTLYDKVSYCGYYGEYKYPSKSKWDKTETITSNYYSGAETLNGSKYTITFIHRFTYEGWNTDVGPYTRGINEVVKTYKISGKLLGRNSDSCITSETPTPFSVIENCPSGIVEGTSAVQLTANRFSVTLLDDSTADWKTSNSNILKIVSNKNNPLTLSVKGYSPGTATITYSIQRKDTKEVLTASCNIEVYSECKKVNIKGSTSILKNEYEDYIIDPYFGGESDWSTSNSNILKLTDTSTYRKTNEGKGNNIGKAIITIYRRIDNCKKELNITVVDKTDCPEVEGHKTKEYELNKNYCYTTNKRAPFICSSSYPYSANGWCFKNYSDWHSWYYHDISVSKEKPNSCDPWRSGMVYSLGYCYYLYPKNN